LVYSLPNHNKLQQFAPAAPDARSSRRCAKRCTNPLRGKCHFESL